jgi:2'-5' RNA ligase
MPLYFVAIVITGGIAQKILEWKQYMQQHFGCKNALKSPAHITLIQPFEMNEKEESNLKNKIIYFSSGQLDFNIEIRNFGTFRPRVIFAEVPAIDSLCLLQRELETELVHEAAFPIKRGTRPFYPHVTIANRDLRKEDFAKAWAYFSPLKYHAVFPAKTLSLLRHTGTHWEILFSADFNNT